MESLEGNLDLESVHEVELLALAAWPGLEVFNIGGWLARFASGITRRANSVWPNMPLTGDNIDALLAEAENFYAAQKLPARFQICPAAQPHNLDEILSQRGYRAVAKTAVQTTSMFKLLSHFDGTSVSFVSVASEPSASWWECYAEADEISTDSIAIRKLICAAIKTPISYAAVIREGKVIGVGSATYASGWIGFFNIATLREHRRTGAARAILAALSHWGQRQGATKVYLQVMAENRAALRLYGGLGFTTGYYYHYREQVL